MAGQRSLGLRELNRSTLARQMLLERAGVPVTNAVERLVGLQAQMARPPYVGLWTRLDGFVAGVWRAPSSRPRRATLVITPFEPLAPSVRAALEHEGEQLLRFAEPAATAFAVRFVD